jgi:hypothetical protein
MSYRPNDFPNLCHLTGAKLGERNELTHDNQPIQLRTILNINYRLILMSFGKRFNWQDRKRWLRRSNCAG